MDKRTYQLRHTPDAVETLFMLNPEPLMEYSPTIPQFFPIEMIPKEKCEISFIQLTICMMTSDFDNVQCQQFQKKFYNCKKWRDALIFRRIEEWETDLLQNLNEKDRKAYIETLKDKKQEYLDKYDKITPIPKNRGKKIRFQSEITQHDWRIKYLIEENKNIFDV